MSNGKIIDGFGLNEVSLTKDGIELGGKTSSVQPKVLNTIHEKNMIAMEECSTKITRGLAQTVMISEALEKDAMHAFAKNIIRKIHKHVESDDNQLIKDLEAFLKLKETIIRRRLLRDVFDKVNSCSDKICILKWFDEGLSKD